MVVAMRLPFVSRSTYEQTIQLTEAAVSLAEDRTQAALREVSRLTDIIVELRREGYNPGPRYDRPEPEPELPDAVIHAIEQRAEPNTPTYRQLVKGAWRHLRKNDEGGWSNTDEIVAVILRGASEEDD